MTLRIPAEVVARVREHALAVHEAKPNHESLGCFVVGDDGTIIRYTRLHNAARRPERAMLASASQLTRRGARLLTVHAHPNSDASPSDLDRQWAKHLRLDPFGIFSIVTDELKLWTLDGDDVREVEFEVAS